MHNPNHGFLQHVACMQGILGGPRLAPKCSVITCALALIQQGKPESAQMQFQQVYIDKRRAALAEQIAGLKAELAACEEELSNLDKSDPSRGQKRESQVHLRRRINCRMLDGKTEKRQRDRETMKDRQTDRQIDRGIYRIDR